MNAAEQAFVSSSLAGHVVDAGHVPPFGPTKHGVGAAVGVGAVVGYAVGELVVGQSCSYPHAFPPPFNDPDDNEVVRVCGAVLPLTAVCPL